MLRFVTTKRFDKSHALAIRRGKNTEKLEWITSQLLQGHTLPARYRDHKLTGNHKGCRECHIEPDWLLVYRIEDNCLILEDTGTHTDLF